MQRVTDKSVLVAAEKITFLRIATFIIISREEGTRTPVSLDRQMSFITYGSL